MAERELYDYSNDPRSEEDQELELKRLIQEEENRIEQSEK